MRFEDPPFLIQNLYGLVNNNVFSIFILDKSYTFLKFLYYLDLLFSQEIISFEKFPSFVLIANSETIKLINISLKELVFLSITLYSFLVFL